MALVNLRFPIEEFIKVIGKMGYNMEKEKYIVQKRKFGKKVCGMRERELDGQLMKLIQIEKMMNDILILKLYECNGYFF